MATKRRRKKKSGLSPIAIIIILIIALISYVASEYMKGGEDTTEPIDTSVPSSNEITVSAGELGNVEYHFIDVGQGDAILITTAEGNILVDTSEIGERDLLVKYLSEQNITSLKYLILTHTDADHIGSADYVVENYDVDTVMMTDYEATTKTYERLLTAIENKNTNVIIAESGYVFTLGALQMTVIGPAEKINDPNEMSLVIKAEHGDTSVMLTGDAEFESEAAILKHWSDESLQVDILKVGHHGSRTSTTDEFLAAMNPSVAVISCGEGNSYGHPHEEIVDKLTEKGIKIYRTDKDGTIVIISDGKEWNVVED